MRLAEFWAAIRDRIDTPTMQRSLGGRERIYRPTDRVPEQEAEPSAVWGRVVMRPTLWPSLAEPGAPRNVSWLMMVQFNDFAAKGYDVDVAMQAVHEEIYLRLDNFVPVGSRLIVWVPIWRFADPPAAAIYDGSRRLWISNAEYRSQVAP